MAATDPVTPEPRRFSIGLPHWGWFLLGAVLLVAGYFGLSIWLPYHREQQVIQKINRWGGEVEIEAGGRTTRAIGEDRVSESKIFDRVAGVALLSGSTITDAEVADVSRLSSLRRLSLRGSKSVTDDGLARLMSANSSNPFA